ncbi:MAG: universal stress protein [Ferruginibacter sp.]
MTEYNIRKILVPVDFSRAAINALDTAIALANQHNATILLLNVIETGGMASDNSIHEHTINAMIRNSKDELQSLQVSIIDRLLLPCEVVNVQGKVAPSILSTCHEQQIDLVVMGTHGESGFKEIFIGSNAYNVVINSACPVLTIPPEKKWEQFRKILFPIRPIPSAIEKYDFVKKIMSRTEGEIKILGLANDYEREVDILKDMASQLNERLKDDKVRTSAYFKVGSNMADEVLKIAGLMETDLIVITATIDPASNQFFVGHYTQYIINHSHYPVLSIKPAGNERYDLEATQFNESVTPEMQFYN